MHCAWIQVVFKVYCVSEVHKALFNPSKTTSYYYVSPVLTHKNSTLCPQNIFMSLVLFSHKQWLFLWAFGFCDGEAIFFFEVGNRFLNVT